MPRILIIRLGALGDFVLSFAAFAAIRAHHPGAEITLLTTAPFVALAEAAPWFDRVRCDRRPAWWNLPGILTLRRNLRNFDLVYDLQTSARSARYFRLAGRPPWSGVAPGCSLPQPGPERARMHTLERQRDQLRRAGIVHFPPADLGWLIAAGTPPALARPYALLVPGAAAHRPEKRWPAERFAGLASALQARGLQPVILGSAGEAPLAARIRADCPAARDLTGRTGLADLATLAAGAERAIGNDTGPMHLAAAVGCRSLVLFSGASDPALTAPRGPDGGWPTVLRAGRLDALELETVLAAL